jgi:hypothetical protein
MKRVSLFAIAVLAIIGATGCPSSTQSLKDFRVALAAVQQGEITAHQDGFISDADHKSNELIIEDVAQAGLAADEALLVLKSNTGATAALTQALTDLDQLNTIGATHITDPLKQQEFHIAVQSVITIVQNVEITLKAQGGK